MNNENFNRLEEDKQNEQHERDGVQPQGVPVNLEDYIRQAPPGELNFLRRMQNLPPERRAMVEDFLSSGCNATNTCTFVILLSALVTIIFGFILWGCIIKVRFLVEFGMSIFYASLLDSLTCICLKKWFPESSKKRIHMSLGILYGSFFSILGAIVLSADYDIYSESFNFLQILFETMVSVGPGISVSWALFPYLEDILVKISE